MKRLLLVLSILVLSTAALAACNGSDTTAPDTTADESADTTEGMETGDAMDATVMTLDTFAFDPMDLTVTAGQAVNLTLDNTGQALEHSWVLVTADMTLDDAKAIQDQGDADKKLFEARVAPGETSSSTFTAPDTAGTYIVVCAVPGHAAGGMTGSLIVQ
jgi:uncharacterized cupredoxin-like copper-binding protein